MARALSTLLLSTALPAIALALSSPFAPAHAFCVASPATPRDWNCSGAIALPFTLDARTLSLTGAKISAFVALRPKGDGGLGFAMDAASAVNATTGAAVSLTTDGTTSGDISSNAMALSGIAGPIRSTAGFGISAMALGPVGSVDLTTGPGATISGAQGGVLASSAGGEVALRLGGAVSSSAGVAVETRAVDRQTMLILDGPISGAAGGVKALATGRGDIGIGASAKVDGGKGVGIAVATGSGAIQIDLGAGSYVSGAAGGLAIKTGSGLATIDNAGTIGADAGAVGAAFDLGTGTLQLKNDGTIRGIGAAAIMTNGGGADLAILNTGIIDGAVAAGGPLAIANAGEWTNVGGSQVTSLSNAAGGLVSFGAAGGAPQVLTVTGDMTLAPSSSLVMRIGAAGADRIVVGGQAALAGVLTLDGVAGVYAPRTRYTLVTATGGLSGQFDRAISLIPSLVGVLSYDPDNAYVTILQRDFRDLARTRNQYAVADGLWRGAASLNAQSGAFLTALNAIAPTDMPGALERLSGEGLMGADHAALRAGEAFTGQMNAQQDFWRSSDNRIWAPSSAPPVSRVVSKSGGRPRYELVHPDLARWRVWGGGYGARGVVDGLSSVGAAAQSNRAFGGALGLDYQVGQFGLIGAALGMSQSSFSVSARQTSGSAQGFHGGVYAGFRIGGFYGAASVAYSGYSNATTRNLTGVGALTDQIKANFSSTEVRARFETGRRFEMSGMAITPFVAIESARLRTAAFVESASGINGLASAALSVDARAMTSTPSFVGLKLEGRIDMASMRLAPWISIGWRHEWAGSEKMVAAFVALPGSSFMVFGARAPRDALQLKGGLQMDVTRLAAVFASFEADFAARSPSYIGKAGLKVAW